MKTTTVRLEDEQVMVLEQIAKADDCKTSDLVRAAIRDFIDARAQEDVAIEATIREFAEQRLEQSRQQIANTLGATAIEGPRDER